MQRLFFLGAFLFAIHLQAQNLILNPNFEEGSTVTGSANLPFATHWDHGCGLSNSGAPYNSSDLYDEDVANGSSICGYDVPLNRFFSNLSGKIGNRYAGFISGASDFQNGPMQYQESILGTLSKPLRGDCRYIFKMHIANAERRKTGGDPTDEGCDGPYIPYVIAPDKTIDIVLRKNGNCNEGLTILTFNLDDNTSWTAYESGFTLTADDLAEGYDRIEIRRGAVSNRINVMCDAVSLIVDPEANQLDPSFVGDTEFCAGDPLTFIGMESSGTTDNTFWEIQETNQYGVPVVGGYNWYTWTSGAPGTFTFPEEVNPPCNRYYWIKMAVSNACYIWEETLQVIRINCNPKAPKGVRTTICEEECITLAEGSPMYINHDYQWFSDGVAIENGGQLPLTVCPEEYTVYILVVTDEITGCSTTSAFSVGIAENDPTWSHSENTSVSPYYFNIEAIANDLDTDDVEGFGYAWRIEKLDNDLDPVCEVYNPSCWWTHPAPTAFDSYNGSCVAACSSSQPGRFYYNRYYRITRGTWTKTCPWRQQSKIIYATPGRSPESGPIVTTYEVEAPDMRDIMKPKRLPHKLSNYSFEVFPNPNQGATFFLQLKGIKTMAEEMEINIANVNGQILYTQKESIASGQTTVEINNATKLPAGIYLITLTGGGEQYLQKMVVQ